MKNINFKTLLPYLTALVLFAGIAMVYFYPILQGYKIKQADIKQHRGMAHELASHRDNFDEEPLWVGNMFAGMPAYQVSKTRYSGDIMPILKDITFLGLPYPVGILFAYMIGFFIFSLSLRINPWISLIGAIAYGFSSYFLIIIEAGHTSKSVAIAFVPPLIGGVISVLRGRLLIGSLLVAVFLGLELYANHLQITYYSIFIILAIGIVELIHQLKQSVAPQFFKRVGILLIAVIIGILPNLGNLLTTYEYSKASTRSPSELTIDRSGNSNEKIKSTGLDKDYITRWSYGIEETFSLLLPNIKGGKSGAILGDEEEVQRLRKENPSFFNFMVKDYQENQNVINTYWGNQPFTSGSVYVGVIIFFLAFLALFFVKDRLIIAFGVVTILTILLSWGKNFMPFTDFFIDHIPLYNKFRAVAMILVVVEFTLPVFAILFISKLIQNREEIWEKRKKLTIVSASFVGVLLLFMITPNSFFDFMSQDEQQYFADMINSNPNSANVINSNMIQLESYRIEIFRDDVMRSLQFLFISIALIALYLFGKVKKTVLLLGLGVFIFIDLWMVGKTYIHNKENPNTSRSSSNRYMMYEKPITKSAPYKASPVDMAILQKETQQNPDLAAKIKEKIAKLRAENPRPAAQEVEDIQFTELMRETHYRVMNSIKKMDEDAETAYFHKTLGGYHGAKMKKYQELIDFELGEEHYQIRQSFLQGGKRQVLAILPKMNATNMMNAKYIIGAVNAKEGQSLTYVENPYALGNAWFVEQVKFVPNANEEITSLKTIDLSKTAIARKEDKELISESYAKDNSAKISLVSYLPNELVYSYHTKKRQFAVFSEVYYDKGWNAYINNEKIPYIKVNYILRGMELPAGSGELVFKFEPTSHEIGEKATWLGSLLILLLIVGVGYKKLNSED